MIYAKNLWEAKRLRECTTVEAVDAEIARCQHGRAVAPNGRKRDEWIRKINWLNRVKQQLA